MWIHSDVPFRVGDGRVQAETIECGLDPIDIILFSENAKHGLFLVRVEFVEHGPSGLIELLVSKSGVLGD